jgi:hypothetical protein
VTCELAGNSQKSVTCPWARETLGNVLNRVRGPPQAKKKKGDVSCISPSDDMASLANIDPSLRDMSFADVNPSLSTATTSQDRQGADGNSESSEPVHHSAFLVPTKFLMSFHFQNSPRGPRQRPFRWTFTRDFQAQTRQVWACV